MRVGCRFTNVCRNDANSEYRLRTSRPYIERIRLLKLCGVKATLTPVWMVYAM